MKTLTFSGDLLLTLLLHVGAAASICAWLARSATFRKVLYTELRDSDQKLKLMLFVTPPLLFGVFLRILGAPYRAADLMLEGSFLLGLLGGRVVGPLGGSIISLPAFGHASTPQWLFYVDAGKSWGIALVLLSAVMAVAVPLKIWSNTRLEMNLEQHQQLLLKARMDALTAQINPHFLFNTLNTVSSLIRYSPDMARDVVIKFGNILRRLLRKHETFVPLQEELEVMDDSLHI